MASSTERNHGQKTWSHAPIDYGPPGGKAGEGLSDCQAAPGRRELPNDSYSHDVEQDLRKWEEAETSKNHYQQLQAKWT